MPTQASHDSASRMRPTVAFVLPCYNEEAVLPETARRLVALRKELVDAKIIAAGSFLYFVDDGSRDSTWQIITDWHSRHPDVHGLKLARNVGHQHALYAGLMSVRDRVNCAISLDADLQQDEQAIPLFLEKYQAGAEIVFGIRRDRGTDSFIKRVTAQAFYRIMRLLGVKVIDNHADYRLVGRSALDALAQYPEVNLFLRGLFSDLGFRTDRVFFDVSKRFAGTSKYSLRSMLSFAWDGITSFSIVPLRFVSGLGLVIFLLSILMSLYILISSLVIGGTVPGWASTTLPIYFIGGVQIMCTGLIGEYIGKIYKEVKARPRFMKETEI